jgi:trans-2,3-dihydro-3-hydroxyanthranilate isomerase
MTSIPYYLIDVFTDKAFGGNPLAVFMDADNLSSQQMQSIAKEMNLAETVFVCTSSDKEAWARVRIFTTEEELPFAGHPNVGTSALLAIIGRVPKVGKYERPFQAYFDEKVGKIQIDVEQENLQGKPLFKTTLTTAVPASLKAGLIGVDKYASVLGLQESDFHPHVETHIGNAGLDFGLVVANSKEAIDEAELNTTAWAHYLKGTNAKFTYFAFIDVENKQVYTRMFCPSIGMAEDPATGSAAAALSGLLAQYFPQSREDGELSEIQKWTITQGVKMGRPSTLKVQFNLGFDTQGNRLANTIKVGGTSVLMAKGEFYIND